MATPVQAPEQILTLSQTSNLLRRFAAAHIAQDGAYYCVVDGKRTKVVADKEA